MKIFLAKVIGSHNLYIDELYSITVKIEAILNSRPLTPLDSAQDDGIEVLTPGHFLLSNLFLFLISLLASTTTYLDGTYVSEKCQTSGNGGIVTT